MNKNDQVLPPDHGDGLSLLVKEIFYTIQGEGPFTGHPAIFIRLAGCNLACFWCDTDYRVEDPEQTTSVGEIVRKLEDLCPRDTLPLIVLTGGEPFRQNIQPLVAQLLNEEGYRVQIETSGSAWCDLKGAQYEPDLHIVCCPKVAKVHPRLEEFVAAFKYVLAAGEVDHRDGLPSRSTQDSTEQDNRFAPARPKDERAPIYVQPLDHGPGFEEENAANARACVESAQAHGYIVSMQMHKILGVE